MKLPQTPRKGTENFLQRMMRQEEERKATIAELLAETMKLRAENERLRDMLSLPHPVRRPRTAGTGDSKQSQ